MFMVWTALTTNEDIPDWSVSTESSGLLGGAASAVCFQVLTGWFSDGSTLACLVIFTRTPALLQPGNPASMTRFACVGIFLPL
jgi:hypothetical protein